MTSEARQLYVDLAMLSHGSTQAFDSAGAAGIPDSREPSGDATPPHERFRIDYERRGSSALPYWQKVLNDWRGQGRVVPKGKSEDDLILEDGEGFSPKEVAEKFRCTPTRVRRLRAAHKRDAETGVPLAKLKAKIGELRAQGKSYRAIGEELGRSKTRIHDLDRAA